MEASHKTHRPHIKVGKDEEEEEESDAMFRFYIETISVMLLMSVSHILMSPVSLYWVSLGEH